MTSSQAPHLLATVLLAGIVGLLVGSFLNVVVYRVPRHLSVAGPRSFCPTCHTQLRGWENVPVASWIALGGRCRTCRQPISVRYPLVELGTGTGFALVTWGWRGSLVSAAYCALFATMLAISLIEFGRRRAPLWLAAIGTGVALAVLLVAAGWHGLWHIAVGAVIGAFVTFAVLSFLRARDPECSDPLGYGRSAILVAGCWCGGLGWVAAVIGIAAWFAAYLLCLEGARWAAGGRRHQPAPRRAGYPVFDTPLVSALVLGMAVSFIAGI